MYGWLVATSTRAASTAPTSTPCASARSTRGALSDELAQTLADARAGTPLTQALERLADRTGLAPLTRFAEGIAVAVERGTPLADVLRDEVNVKEVVLTGDVDDFVDADLTQSLDWARVGATAGSVTLKMNGKAATASGSHTFNDESLQITAGVLEVSRK